MCQVYASCLTYVGLFKSYSNSVDALWIHRQSCHHNDLYALCMCGMYMCVVCSVCVVCVYVTAQILGSHPRPADSDAVGVALGGSPGMCILMRPPGYSDVC